MAAPAFRSKGAFGSGTTSAVAAVPTAGDAPQADDILLIVCESSDSTTAAGTPNTPGGWTKIFEETQGDGATGVTTLTVFGKRAGASESDVTIDGVGDHIHCIMIVYSGAVTSETAWVVGSGNGADSGNPTILGLNTPTNDCRVIGCVAITRDANASANFSSWSMANPTSDTERHDQTTTTGAGGGIGIVDGTLATAGATGDTTVTAATSAQWRAVHVVLKSIAEGGGHTVAVGQNTETDTAQVVAKIKNKAVGQNSETDTSQPIARQKIKAIAQNTETDTAQSIALARQYSVGLNSETDSAQSVTSRKSLAIGLNSETDNTQSIAPQKSLAIGINSETDTAQTITPQHTYSVASVSETDTAQSITVAKVVTVAQVTENDSVQTVIVVKHVVVNQAQETDLAQPITESGAQVVPVGQAIETDEVQAVARIKIHVVTQVSETDLAQQLFPQRQIAIVQVVETDLSQAIAITKTGHIGQAAETDLAQPITPAGPQIVIVNQAIETDIAQSITLPVAAVIVSLHLHTRDLAFSLDARDFELALSTRVTAYTLEEV